ncbi:MAG: endo-1,4-beta-xylanase [Desulfobacterales bacterium]|nr:MAG: endo-1,4-beta-xylanase [Desulfobacterales bacterium]
MKRTVRTTTLFAISLILHAVVHGAEDRPLQLATSIEEEAARGIERHRKGDVSILLRFPDGRPVANMTVEARQVSHDFHFGNYIRPRHYENQAYLNRFRELFNAVQLLEFNWGQYEPDEGQPLLQQRRDFIRNWCRPRGLDHFYGHMLVWTRQYGEYPRTGLPLWLFKYDQATQYDLLRKRIQREVSAYKDINLTFDVVNEAVHCRVWGDWEKDSYIQNKTPEPLARIVPYVRDALTWAHKANPDARLLINDYEVIVKGRFQDQYKALIDALLSENVLPLSAIGIQAHEPYKGRYWYSPEELWTTYNLFGKETGLPIYITEFFQVSGNNERIRGNYRSGHWSQELQADAIEQFYRITFGHPSIEAIYYFGMTDADVTTATCGLLDKHYQPKAAWHRLKKLILDEWTTKTAGQTAADGRFRFRGFFGKYRIRVSRNGVEQQFDLYVGKGERNDFELVVKDPGG